jgi:hypothetical protein
MTIRLDISHLPIDLRHIILNNIEIAEIRTNAISHSSNDIGGTTENTVILLNNNSIQKIKEILQDILTSNSLHDYIITENTQQENELVILKQGDIEQFGIYICTHCAMSFRSENQRSLHERMHYFI